MQKVLIIDDDPDIVQAMKVALEFDLTKDLIERNYWLIRLRWVAVAGVNVTILFSSQILKFSLPIFFFTR